ncbi:hypothetical protein C8F04DRAFT_1248591 [Mycena alexandri]|uniref:Uncharacterized protein n=1 Tax=Mycena alexandri TaxID=1745969 RepID=A0AAD6XFP8_9AGAR|nr:hypothetical protein C8F04DRAFT_1248591 [Mycena alexandri]
MPANVISPLRSAAGELASELDCVRTGGECCPTTAPRPGPSHVAPASRPPDPHLLPNLATPSLDDPTPPFDDPTRPSAVCTYLRSPCPAAPGSHALCRQALTSRCAQPQSLPHAASSRSFPPQPASSLCSSHTPYRPSPRPTRCVTVHVDDTKSREDFNIVPVPLPPPPPRAAVAVEHGLWRVIRRVHRLFVSLCTAPRSRGISHSPTYPTQTTFARHPFALALPRAALLLPPSTSLIRRMQLLIPSCPISQVPPRDAQTSMSFSASYLDEYDRGS